ncbi:MAG: phosphocholine cytidylyltransferase family protein [Oscillospiraceae bacterium]|nr:phosphocholine cytidylyltransferase family protein [Oscillospiraceae bacterium]
MRAILMAAGKGSRISRMIEAVPKCTLPIGGKPLIRRTVELLRENGIACEVCVGYKREQVCQALEGLDVVYHYNPFYEVTNSIASLWFARESICEDMLLLNADVYFSHALLQKLLARREEAIMLVDRERRLTGDYFFSTADNGCIKKYGKDLPIELRSCEYVGVAKLDRAFCPLFTRRMEELIQKGKYRLWWENVLYSMADEGEHAIHTLDVEGEFWSEIDYFDDYERILKYMEQSREI